MSIKALSVIKGITAWGGVITTLSGVAFGIYQGASIWTYTTTLIGVALTSVGHLIGIAQAAQQKAAKEEAEKRIEELEGMAYEADEMLRDPHFKRLVERERMDYMIEHQDDGR